MYLTSYFQTLYLDHAVLYCTIYVRHHNDTRLQGPENHEVLPRLPSAGLPRVRRPSDTTAYDLDSAESLQDLRGLPSNRLEALSGVRAGEYSIRVNRQWRICFRWGGNGPYDVEIVDYHR